jgi:leader peptidase (prepilin peptidase) / N-methyltransferase
VSEAGAATARPLAGRGTETATGVVAGCLVVASFAHFGLGARGLVSAFFLAVLVILARIDLERRILPDRIVLPAAAAVLVAQLVLFPDRALEWILAPLAAFAILFVPLLVRPNGIGFGDVKLMLLLGAALGFAVLDALLIGFLLVVPVALFLLFRDGATARTRAIPLGPFLVGGAVLALFLG